MISPQNREITGINAPSEHKNPPTGKTDVTGSSNNNLVPLLLFYSNKTETVRTCQQATKLFEMLPPAQQVIPTATIVTCPKRYWKPEEDEFIRQQYAAGFTVAQIAKQMASNRWAIKKRVEQLELLAQ
jgi:hypothetical protein